MSLATEKFLSMDQVKTLVSEAVTDAVKGINKVDPDDRPAAAKSAVVSNFSRQRYAIPRLGEAMKAGYVGGWRQSQTFAKDVHEATKDLFGFNSPDQKNEEDPFIESFEGGAKSTRSIFWPKSREEFVEVLWAMGEKRAAKNAETDQVDAAIKAMSENLGGAGAGGALVPPQYLQDQFAYALTSTVAVRQIPGVTVLPVTSYSVILPRESTPAGGSTALEAGTLNAQDATLSQQTITVKKQYGFRRYSNELFADANPAWMEFLAKTLTRDVALVQDLQYIEGSGSGSNIQGIVGYSGLTTGPSLGTNGRTPTFDDFFESQYLLRVANSEPDFVIAHPRVLNTLQKQKDSTGNYLMSNMNGYNPPKSYGTGLDGSPPKAVLIGALGTYFSSQASIARTVGSSTTATTIIVGDSRSLVILERQGLEVAFSEHLYFNTDETAARCIGRSAIALIQPTAVTTIAGALA